MQDAKLRGGYTKLPLNVSQQINAVKVRTLPQTPVPTTTESPQQNSNSTVVNNSQPEPTSTPQDQRELASPLEQQSGLSLSISIQLQRPEGHTRGKLTNDEQPMVTTPRPLPTEKEPTNQPARLSQSKMRGKVDKPYQVNNTNNNTNASSNTNVDVEIIPLLPPVVRPRSKTPDSQDLLVQLFNCKTNEKIKQNCEFLIKTHALKFAGLKGQYNVVHQLETMACDKMLLGEADFARIVFSQINTNLPGVMKNPGVRAQVMVEQRDKFEKTCTNTLASAKDTMSKEQLAEYVLGCHEGAVDLILLGRPEYALIIYEQLIETGCVEKNDQETCIYIRLLTGKETRRNVQASLAHHANSKDRTSSLYTYGLIILAQQSLVNVKASVENFKKAAELGYTPAIQAYDYFVKRFPNGVPNCLDVKETKEIAAHLAREAGFDLGFNHDDKGIFKIS